MTIRDDLNVQHVLTTDVTATPVFPTAPMEYELSPTHGNFVPQATAVPSAPAELQHCATTTSSYGQQYVHHSASNSYSQIPLVPATSVMVSGQNSQIYGSSMAPSTFTTSTTGSPVGYATGPPRPPPQHTPGVVVTVPPSTSSHPRPSTRYRHSNGCLNCCGITLVLTIFMIICCILPLMVVLILWRMNMAFVDSYTLDDDYWDYANNDVDD